jgi:putative tricarboxylic transport membrane protein
LRVQNPQDVYGGMALILLSLIAFVASNDLPGMRGFAFGPGTAPRLFAFTLAILSLGVVIGGLLTTGPEVSGYKIRGVIFIIGSILAFAACIRPLGLVIASFATMVICAAAAEDVKVARDLDRRGCGDRFLLRAVSLWLEPAVPALAPVLVIGENDHV